MRSSTPRRTPSSPVKYGVKQAPTLVVTTEGGFEKYAGAGAIKQYATTHQAQ